MQLVYRIVQGNWQIKFTDFKLPFFVLTDVCYDGPRPRVARKSIVCETPFPNTFSEIHCKSHRVKTEITSFRKRNYIKLFLLSFISHFYNFFILAGITTFFNKICLQKLKKACLTLRGNEKMKQNCIMYETMCIFLKFMCHFAK